MTNIQSICLTVGVVAWLAAMAWVQGDPAQSQRQRNIDRTFDVACQKVGGVTVLGTTPGTIHCVQPVRTAP